MDIERTLEFIVQHQARFAVELDQLKDRHKELSDSVDALKVVVQSQQVHISQIISLTETLARSQTALTESQRHTDERLNALIKVVDDLVRRNGGPR